MSEQRVISFTLNGVPRRESVPVRLHLVDYLRARFELSSPRVGCEHGVCGACTVRVDGEIVRGCLMLAAQLDGRKVETLEGLTETEEIRDLQDEFIARNATQCGYCTAGILMTAAELLKSDKPTTREAIRDHLSGNICRCTGYEAIVDAIETTIKARQQGRSA
jgi:carbon-monoxide dehydrogenase small subunit